MNQLIFITITRVSLKIALVGMLFGCNNQLKTEKKETTGLSASTESTVSANNNKMDACCFTEVSQFEPFIPAGNTLLTAENNKKFASSFYCSPDDDPRRSSANKTYQIDKANTKDPMQAKFLSLRLVDYCSRPAYLADDYKRRRDNAFKYAAENLKLKVQDINSEGVYYGYTYQDETKGNNSQNVLLYAVVGDKFLVHISGVDHIRMDAVHQLFDLIPLKELAAYGK